MKNKLAMFGVILFYSSAFAAGPELRESKNRLELRLDGQTVATWYASHKIIKRPFFAHLKTAKGIPVTRNFPPVEGKDRMDHPDMHPGLWWTFSRLNSVSFWHNQGVVTSEAKPLPDVDGESGKLFELHSIYRTADGKELCRETTRCQFLKDLAGWMLLLDINIKATEKLTFGVREENGLGVRVASPLNVDGGKGTILSSNGDRNGQQVWGKAGQWWDYFGPSGDQNVGVMLMVPPDELSHWAHSRDYGLLVANPFPVDVPENRDKSLIIPAGKSLRLRYGVLVHQHQAGESLDRKAAWDRYQKLISDNGSR